eukprot:5266427-Pleurochrysis_carterae.AAC.1
MHSVAIGSQINASFVHEINAAGTQILIYASQDSTPSDSILFEFVLYVNAEIGIRSILGGPSVVVKLDALTADAPPPTVLTFSSWNIPMI